VARVKPRLRDGTAEMAHRAAVLLQSGVAPNAVWGLLPGPLPERVAARIAAGVPVTEALSTEGEAWRELAAAWAVAMSVGAPLADTLRAFANALHDAGQTLDDIEVALAEPAGTARLMLWLPAAGLVLGLALGFDSIRVLFTDPRGLVCLIAGLALIVGARLWTRMLVNRARPRSGLPGVRAELFAVALSGGVSIDRARALVAHALPGEDDGDDVEEVLSLSRRVGVPAVELLRAASAGQRRAARVKGRADAARLSTRLLLPLGVCTLPAFLLLGVAPLLLAVLAGTGLVLP